MLYLMLTGRRPFEPGDDLLDFILLVRSAPRPPIHAYRRELHPAIDAWAQRALAVNPDERFQSVTELWHALGPLLPRSAFAR